MSLYNNYNVTSTTYDVNRRPFGSDVIGGLIRVYNGKVFGELHVLDAGCGTGNYSKDLLEMGVGHVTMFDASEGMLNKAREKIEPYKDTVTIQQGVLPDLPFPDGRFDVVMFNLVLQHLTQDGEVDPFQQISKALKEAARVLTPGGLLVISTVLPEVLREAYWFCHLVPNLTERVCRKMPPMPVIRALLKDAQLNVKRALNLLGTEFFEQYGDLEGPLKPEWRSSMSYFSVATEDEMKEIEQKVTQLKNDGKLEAFAKEHDKTESYGSFTFVFAVKS